jgi:hypothetical protein
MNPWTFKRASGVQGTRRFYVYLLSQKSNRCKKPIATALDAARALRPHSAEHQSKAHPPSGSCQAFAICNWIMRPIVPPKALQDYFREELVFDYTVSDLRPESRDYKTLVNRFEVQALYG